MQAGVYVNEIKRWSEINFLAKYQSLSVNTCCALYMEETQNVKLLTK